MKIKVNIPRTKEIKIIDLENKSIVGDILKKLDFKPDTIIVMSNNLPIPIDDVVKDNQEFTIIQVSSGG